MAVWNISCISNQLEINMFSCVSYSRNRIYNLHKFQFAAFHHFFMEENIFMQFTVTIKGDACSNTAIQYATQGRLKEMKNWLS